MADLVYLGNHLYSYLISLGILAIAIILGKVIYYISRNIIRKVTEKTKTMLDDILVDVLEKPLVFMLLVIGFYFAYNRLVLPVGVIGFFGNVTKILFIIGVSWFIIKFVDSLLLHYAAPLTKRTKSDLDDQIVPILRSVVKWIIIIVTFIMIVDNFGYDVGSLLAGLGLGGLAFALAAQDMLGNLFGGFSILADSPFKLNERIRFNNYDGWVRAIGLRTTRMETLDGTYLTIPNAMISKTISENVSREKARKIKFTIGVTYDTSTKKLEQAMKIIKDIVVKHSDTDDNCLTAFTEFGAYSLNILAIYWIKNPDKILDVQNEINLEIKKSFEKAKISMAFPTQTLEVKKVR
ncbi:mechanosensitive ion channel protein MscL [Candidatus Woesearchaeota archaeon CG11_big_fil_rev_8_21_14_0_20_43_8]|nr:MAG: mechanosensitive ion channel protein MscL [Candidatus Woesearchaeota archaeon CG11_big_fil_rev_8_21_14_0_20_43_8]PIO08514.1 MAG: mechanosensitive ion channel protein MscL [Candidatus Woesearchaeota archaeon CG08_land_8_20_14_0_20_43_7]